MRDQVLPETAQDNPIAVQEIRLSSPAMFSAPPARLEFLDGLRGLAALYVVLFHFSASRFLVDASGARLPLPLPLRIIAGMMQYGHYAVAIFIVLSGYSLMLPISSASDGQLRGGLWGYVKRRAWRILPPYYAALLLSVFCLAVGKRWQEMRGGALWSHLLLVHNLHPDWNMAINIPLWSVATEWDIYFVFPLLLLPLWRKWGMGAVLAAGFGLGWLPHFLLPPASNLDWACPWYLGLFTLGMGAATIHAAPPARVAQGHSVCTEEHSVPIQERSSLKEGNFYPAQGSSTPAHRRPAAWLLIATIAGSAFLGLTCCYPAWIEQQKQWLDPIVGVFAACLILGCATARLREPGKPGLLLRILEHSWTLRLGAFSYSLYLTHILVKWGLYALLSRFTLSPPALLLCLLGVGVPASLLTAWGFYLLVERRFLSRRSTARRIAPA